MNRNYLGIGLLVLLLLIVGGYLFVQGQRTGRSSLIVIAPTPSLSPLPTSTPSPIPSIIPTPTSSPASQTTVDYNNDGFSPRTITIKTGTTVVWTNRISDPLWIASNPHPQHTGLPELNSNRTFPSDGSFSFTFTQTGRFGYHNHVDPSDTGTVVVE